MRAHNIGFDVLTEGLKPESNFMRKNMAGEAKVIAQHIENFGADDYINTDVWRLAQSKLYKPGDKVYPHGFGWGARDNWETPCYFITSLRAPGGGGYLVLKPNGSTTILTNIRHTKDKWSIKNPSGSPEPGNSWE